MDLDATNYWFVIDRFVCHQVLDCMSWICMALIIELYVVDLYGTNYWIVYVGFVCH